MAKKNEQNVLNGSVSMVAQDIIESDDWELINVLITASGWSKIKGKRKTYLEGGLNYAVAWINTDGLKKIYKEKTGNDIQDFASVIEEDYGASFGMGN